MKITIIHDNMNIMITTGYEMQPRTVRCQLACPYNQPNRINSMVSLVFAFFSNDPMASLSLRVCRKVQFRLSTLQNIEFPICKRPRDCKRLTLVPFMRPNDITQTVTQFPWTKSCKFQNTDAFSFIKWMLVT